ncbi:30S ribosome-binding factor RbfA [Pedococcus bigeumensis]|uniref:30S ribosome-binding factor RbfA n=1 Tax=Pedococcus bigeumensis TaxID=433644 RepID=UPI002FE9DAD8
MADAGRARKIADRIKTLIAANVESIVKDPDLGFITITDVRVTGDLQHASVFYTVFGDETQRAKTAALLEKNKGRLRSFVGGQIQIRLTPSLDFFADAIPETAAHLEDLLREAKERDEAVAAAAAGATYAGEADPYKKPEPGDEDDLDGATDGTDPDSTGSTDDSTDTDGTQDLGADARA